MKFSEQLKRARQRRYGTPIGEEKQSGAKRPVCHQCVHFHVTWDYNFPYGCKAMGFKTKKIPSQDVYESSGIDCQLFSRKPKK